MEEMIDLPWNKKKEEAETTERWFHQQKMRKLIEAGKGGAGDKIKKNVSRMF